MKNLWKNYNLSIVLFILFFFSWFLQAVFQFQEYKNKEHNQEVQISEYGNEFLSATFENWQSEFLQLFTMVVLTSFLIHKGSAESKDSTDKELEILKDIRTRLEKLEK